MNLKKPLIAVSRCLLGDRVRYDGDSKPLPKLIKALESYFSIVGVCPEVECGLTVPRPAVQLVRVHGVIRALGVENKSLDITDKLVTFAHEFIHNQPLICGLVLKTRSPSCGVGTTPVYPQADTGDGLFAATVAQLLPEIPMINESGLLSTQDLQRFIDQVQCYAVKVKYY